MDISTVWEDLAWQQGGKIVYLILDGVGGLPDPDRGGTELQVAQTPNLDKLAKESSCGLLEIVGPGITPVDVVPRPGGMKQRFQTLQKVYGEKYNFYFLHVKHSDSKGEDSNFEGKVKVIEEVDQLLPLLTLLNPDVLVVSADHSTPAIMGQHSWHPVPVMIHSKYAKVDDVATFDEYACGRGMLGLRPGVQLMGLALAHGGRLRKYGA
ncbi:MAG: hypothetical protein RID09_30200 [Coleofasciculus sp. G1-WW12-02]|uniref:hypothetical protein n=1 Tax=Coleofasciculus sp. G1-WW12-02 TaxID=3068483 RepID=UPI003301F818